MGETRLGFWPAGVVNRSLTPISPLIGNSGGRAAEEVREVGEAEAPDRAERSIEPVVVDDEDQDQIGEKKLKLRRCSHAYESGY